MTTIPAIHLNGTGYETLYKEYRAAYDAVKKAIDAMHDTTCNGRDYYVQGGSAFYRARDERQAAIQKLTDARDYLAEILVGIMDQKPDHDRL
jgi:hypothetical protein